MRAQSKDKEQEEMFRFLDSLREDGVVNMNTAMIDLSCKFDIDRQKSREVCKSWIVSHYKTTEAK